MIYNLLFLFAVGRLGIGNTVDLLHSYINQNDLVFATPVELASLVEILRIHDIWFALYNTEQRANAKVTIVIKLFPVFLFL